MEGRQPESSENGILGQRLRMERKARDLTQRQFAEVGGVGLGAQHRYESGAGVPDATYMVRTGEIGVDWHFVLFGERSGERMSPAHSSLIAGYDRLPPIDQLILHRIMASMRHEPAPTDMFSLPDERPLTAMFEALLAGIKPSLPEADKARLLAQRLPIALAQLQDLQPEQGTSAEEEPVAGSAMQHHE